MRPEDNYDGIPEIRDDLAEGKRPDLRPMNSEDIYDGVTDIRDDLVEGAKPSQKRRKTPRKKWWYGAVAAVVALAIVGGVALRPGSGVVSSASAYAIAEAKYPEMAPYPNEDDFWKPDGDFDNEGFSAVYGAWWEDVRAQRRDLGDVAPLREFFARSSRTFLTGAGTENRVYSPLNVYMALGMLAELTGGDCRGQILDLLGAETIEGLRKQAGDVWNANYRDDGATTSVMANSLWLNENVNFVQKTMDTLARDYYASSYRGEMGSEELNKALQDWLNEQTGGLLKDYADNMELDGDTIMALASTLYFRAKWSGEFSKNRTEKGLFHAPGGDVEADFMHQGGSDTYYWGEKFSAVSKSFEEGGEMWFLLPDQGVTPEELLGDAEAADFLFGLDRDEWEKQKYLIVNKAIPRFDVSSQMELGEGLRALGVTDVFDPARSDFSPSTGSVDDSYLSRATHAARVAIDEEGCVAAAFTVMARAGAAEPPEEEVDFVLDRPFLFCITGGSGLPLFVGIVNQPG